MVMTIVAMAAAGCGGSRDDVKKQGSVTTVDCAEFEKLIAEDGVRLVDVRTAKEFADGHIDGASNHDVNMDGFANGFELQKGRKARNTIAVYCRSGKRSLKAANMLAAKGFVVYNLEGGILAWQRERKTVVK